VQAHQVLTWFVMHITERTGRLEEVHGVPQTVQATRMSTMTKTTDSAANTKIDKGRQVALSDAELDLVIGGKPDFQPISVGKSHDAASPQIFH